MPRRRPPGAGPGLFLTVLLVLPLIATAAQQQQPPQNAHRNSPREEAYAQSITSPEQQKPAQGVAHAPKHDAYTSLKDQNERAVATKVFSAPAGSAVRARPDGNAARSGGLSRPSARSLQDWSVEDFVLLATVDGHLHARDRYNGDEIWDLDMQKPMIETIYHTPNLSEGDGSPMTPPFMWIVEPKEDGELYILSPGRLHPDLQRLGMTIKQLADVLSPYGGEDSNSPYVYTAEKKTRMHIVDARTGRLKKTFRPGGSAQSDVDSCEPTTTAFFDMHERECTGYFNLGEIEYTVSIDRNVAPFDNVCTIKYFEWTPNHRDVDLRSQYVETRDNQYIYSRFDGHALAYNHNRPKKTMMQRPAFKQKLSSPVVRVFDVARPLNDEDLEPALALLPQPPLPAVLEEKDASVWLNTTEDGSWYAMSERHYPVVTDSAPDAPCYDPEWGRNVATWDGEDQFPGRDQLVGVHALKVGMGTDPYIRHDLPAIGPPATIHSPISNEDPVRELPQSMPPTIIDAPTPHRDHSFKVTVLTAFIIGLLVLFFMQGQHDTLSLFLKAVRSRLAKPKKLETTMLADQTAPDTQPEPESQPRAVEEPKASLTAPEDPICPPDAVEKAEVTNSEGPEERRVRFDLPNEEEPEMEPISRVTTADESSPAEDAEGADASLETEATISDGTTPNTPATSSKKKKTHRGRRGGGKKARKQKEEEEIDQAVQAAKEMGQTPVLHPDEVIVDGDDVQDVSNMKKIGKLTIDFDRCLGNGSGGTFVFEGKWKEKEVAVKRMLPQYFGLAEQEIKLLQESDLHPNVIRYFDDEKDENFLYIAVELCQSSLWDLYRDAHHDENPTDYQLRLANEINFDVPRALYQLALGLNHLHSLRIIHRDIKPQNILIAYPQKNSKGGPRLVISDFGLCKTLPDNVSTLIGTTGNAGTVGWKAPELITQPKDMERGSSTGHSRDSSSSTDPVAQGVKRAVDIFSLGCVFFYVLTNGSHPFDDEEGWIQMRELNIKKDLPNFTQLRLGDDSEEPIHLISWMVSNRAEDRPTALEVMNHPFFWSAEKRLTFLCDCSDHWEREVRDPPSEHLSILESFIPEVLDKKLNFLGKLDRNFVDSLGKQRKYTGDRMLDLLRALRNKKNHYEDMEENVKAKVGALPHGYLRYWTTKFPKLLMSCYESVKECGLEREPRFRPYFEAQNVN
ncbi:hypothetical protein EJ04DRAFT_482542 [Polyplosphaeria fusca]|uniref:non-specific serine/threonine protein kinase n=1 Tax=Polyplosphaeria fusca TaxID=682080 RepID=A0A9P4RBS2_9PLEO|nr:hypothetical protein EJ04DRAFT_482542 [Polyplosphaeria fusca]